MRVISDIDEPIFEVEKYDVILIGTTVYGYLSGGLACQIRYKYPIVEEINNYMPYGDLRRLGTRKNIEVPDGRIVSLLYIGEYPNIKRQTVNYKHLKKCLKACNVEFKGKKCMTTVLGASRFDGNAPKDECLKIIEENTPDLFIDVYDYEQLNLRQLRTKVFVLYFDRKIRKDYHKRLSKLYREYYVGL